MATNVATVGRKHRTIVSFGNVSAQLTDMMRHSGRLLSVVVVVDVVVYLVGVSEATRCWDADSDDQVAVIAMR